MRSLAREVLLAQAVTLDDRGQAVADGEPLSLRVLITGKLRRRESRDGAEIETDHSVSI